MSVVTKIACLGLIRDSAAELASQANGLRKAENVVLRSPGVLETRPSFEEIYEDRVTLSRVRAIHEFDGEIVAVEANDSNTTWAVRRTTSGNLYQGPPGTSGTNPAKPVDYDASETRFAESRESLYLTAQHGVIKIETVSNTGDARALQFAGVEMQTATDLLTHSINDSVRGYSWAYQFVFVRTDRNGYVRRSPPSARYVVTSKYAVPTRTWGATGTQATRVYFPQSMNIGDVVEAYRSRTGTDGTPGVEMFLAWSYTLTNADTSAGYFTPPVDTYADDDLGAALYTNTTQGGAIAAKYPPPIAQSLALFAGAMWYGRTKSKHRAGFNVRSINLSGRIIAPCSATYTSGSASVVVLDSSRYTLGAYWTDNLAQGPSAAGVKVPAGTIISAIPDATHITMSATALATGAAYSGQMYLDPPVGFATQIQLYPGGGDHIAGSPYVTGIADTSGLVAGMAWSDSTVAGPAVAGTLTQADTLIAAVTSGTTITLTKNALATGRGGSGWDCIAVDGVYFYFYPGETGPLVTGPGTPPWSWPTRCVPYWGNQYESLAYLVDSDVQIMSLMSNLCEAVNYYQLTHQSTFSVRAIPNGQANTDLSTNAAGAQVAAISDFAHGVTFEEVGVGGDAFVIVVPRATAIDPAPALQSTNDDRPNRLFWSDLNEPESVPLANFVDIGQQTAPILALVPLRNALLVFKADGVWRVTGAGPSNWTVEPLDPTLRLLRPEAVTASQNKAYAWCAGGFFEFDEGGARSLTAEKLDRELRDFSALVTNYSDTHGTFVVSIQQRNLVLLGVPEDASATQTAKVYAYNQTTQAWTEWPVAWSHACESASLDRCYYSRPEAAADGGFQEIKYEVRRMTSGYRGFDRTYELGPSLSVSGTTVTISASDIGTWRPTSGDWISGLSGETRYFRRIVSASYLAGTWTFELEAQIADGASLLITDTGVFFVTDGGDFFLVSDLSAWEAHEGIAQVIEWHPTAPAGLPVGAIARELQFQLDLTAAPDPKYEISVPEYIVGGSSERDYSPTTLTSNLPRVPTVQPLRVGVPRAIARGANIAPYFGTSDIYAFRLVGASIVHEGVSERTRR